MALDSKKFQEALGVGILACWGSLTSDAQQQIFEAAVESSQDPSMRDDLAIFLHVHHPRTEEAKRDASASAQSRI